MTEIKPLSDIRVLDLTTLLPGPLATLFLAEAGADVLKIEPPGGDDMRRFPPIQGGVSAAYSLLNRGKRSLTLDLKSDTGKDALATLIRDADVLVEQFRPGVLHRLGFGRDRLADLNPKLIVCSITGYGQDGPRRDEPGHDLNYMAASGLLAVSPGSPDAPVVPPALIADIAGGSFPAVINILLALRQRDRTGEGCRIDIAMTDALFTLAFWGYAQLQLSGAAPAPGCELLSGGSPRYRLYPASDGALIAVGALEQKFWNRFCELIDLPEALREDAVDPEATEAAVAALLTAKSSGHWAGVFDGQDCCANVVRTLDQAVGDPHFAGRGLFAGTVEGAGRTLGALPVPISPALGGRGDIARAAPIEPDMLSGPLDGWPQRIDG
ncbi:CaiB/BaiF CoA transferase family protein [Tepidamorphus sp. 3E244]|uniref:CaiB/BaiF CoA transferase family protein n=1 Tax=Tepidamorphus sp. 3E244 TaxID=3385498 RepID=UPI0038FCEBA0